MKAKIIISIAFLLLLLNGITSTAQNIAITDDDGYNADNSAMLDVKSTNKGVLLPRLTTGQRNAVINPATGLLVFDTDENNFYFYDGTAWLNVSSGSETDPEVTMSTVNTVPRWNGSSLALLQSRRTPSYARTSTVPPSTRFCNNCENTR